MTSYTEKYGIVDGIEKENKLIYYTNHASHGQDKSITYKVIVDLKTNKEISRIAMKRYYQKGNVNLYL